MPALPVVLVAEELAPSALQLLEGEVELRSVDGADRAALLPALADADAVVVRSATRVDAEALAAAPRLTVVARAGIGLDNVDVPAATARGVLVVNAPASNIVSAAEHAVGLLLAVARSLPQAHASLVGGRWERSRFIGVEVHDKTVGVLGLGRIGVLFAQRLSAFGASVVAYDPYVAPARAAQLGVRLGTLDEVLAASDFVSVHLPRTPETVGLVGERELALMRPTAVLVNAARGGIVDEAALHDALAAGRLRGAGLDVYSTEPMTDSPLFRLPNVVVTPHLGASTAEAQDKAGTAVARSVLLALAGDFVPDAVNVQAGGVVAPDVRPGLPLAEVLGRVLGALVDPPLSDLCVEVRGEITSHDVSVLQLAALKGVFSGAVEEQVTFVNAPALAQERGVALRLVTDAESPEYRNLVTVAGTQADGGRVSVSGTLSGPRQVRKLVAVDGLDVDVALGAHHVLLRYADRPGVVGEVGRLLGEADVNIAAMQVARRAEGGDAVVVLTLDSAVPADVLAGVRAAIDASDARTVDLV